MIAMFEAETDVTPEEAPIGYALNTSMPSSRFPFFEQNETHIRIRNPRGEGFIWSPLHCWEIEQPKILIDWERQRAFRFPYVIQDHDRLWFFMLNEQEVEDVKSCTLQLFWDREHEWCLVTRRQRELLLEPNRTALNDLDTHFNLYGQISWMQWTSIRDLQAPGRQFSCVRRQPVRDQKGGVLMAKDKDEDKKKKKAKKGKKK